MADAQEQAKPAAGAAAEGSILDEIMVQTKLKPTDEGYEVAKKGVQAFISHMLSGAANQIFVGGTFPADTEYREEIQELALRVGKTLAAKSVVGLLSVDFLSARTATGWQTSSWSVSQWANVSERTASWTFRAYYPDEFRTQFRFVNSYNQVVAERWLADGVEPTDGSYYRCEPPGRWNDQYHNYSGW